MFSNFRRLVVLGGYGVGLGVVVVDAVGDALSGGDRRGPSASLGLLLQVVRVHLLLIHVEERPPQRQGLYGLLFKNLVLHLLYLQEANASGKIFKASYAY